MRGNLHGDVTVKEVSTVTVEVPVFATTALTTAADVIAKVGTAVCGDKAGTKACDAKVGSEQRIPVKDERRRRLQEAGQPAPTEVLYVVVVVEQEGASDSDAAAADAKLNDLSALGAALGSDARVTASAADAHTTVVTVVTVKEEMANATDVAALREGIQGGAPRRSACRSAPSASASWRR